MKYLSLLMLLILGNVSFSQIVIPGDTLVAGKYDTLQIEISGHDVFPFCSKEYKIPRQCGGSLNPNCCRYSTSIFKGERSANWGYVACHNGSSFTWHYMPDIQTARLNFESLPNQMEKHSKRFQKTKVRCLVAGKEEEGYLIEVESSTGSVYYTLLSYGSLNGYSFYLDYRSKNSITPENIPAYVQEILKIIK